MNQTDKQHWFQKQLNLFYIALAFLTRIPVPSSVDYSQTKLNQASRYFSLVGWIIGLLSATIFAITNLLLPTETAVLVSMLFSVLITGCFHEDGLADTCDGFGGGWKSADKLAIMKDSRLGTYGAVGLWFILAIKFSLLSNLTHISLALIVAHPLSRCVSTLMIFLLPYVSDTETSKVKPLAESHQKIDLKINLAIGLAALLLVTSQMFLLAISLGITVFLLRLLFLNQIEGFTGDTLGATQQISEVVIYLVLIISGLSI